MKLLTWTLGMLAGAAATIYVLQLTGQKKQRAKSWEALARQRPFGSGPDRKPVDFTNDDVMDAVRFAISWLREHQHRQ